MDIRKSTVLIIKRGAEFLVGRIPYSMEFRWSGSPYDAWNTRVREQAEAVARVTGGGSVAVESGGRTTEGSQ